MLNRTEKDHLWMANLDREVTPAEALHFQQQLSETEQTRMAHEVHLEELLVERLLEGPDCPEALWRSIAGQVAQRKPARVSRRPVFAWAAGLAAAAALVLVAGAAWMALNRAVPEALAVNAPTVEALAAESQTTPDRAAVETFLRDHDFALALNDFDAMPPASEHAVALLGARDSDTDGMVELLYNCCGRPMKLYLARPGSEGAQLLAEAGRRGGLLEQKTIGGYAAGVAGNHHADNLLRVLTALEA
ncbi:MAG: hypothetical protein GC168_19000 [Candidatus Hydrogenedens sp.]|nr:hypothetical protein [Candidatus Hydrogenedens sp.]